MLQKTFPELSNRQSWKCAFFGALVIFLYVQSTIPSTFVVDFSRIKERGKQFDVGPSNSLSSPFWLKKIPKMDVMDGPI